MVETGRSSVWLEHWHGVPGVAGSSPVAPIEETPIIFQEISAKQVIILKRNKLVRDLPVSQRVNNAFLSP